MEIRTIILARSLQMMRSASGAVAYFPTLVQEIKAKYSFLGSPKDEDLLPSDPPKGAEFKHGKLETEGRTIIIDTLTVFGDGIVADAASSTDDTDAFLTDLIEWAKTAIPKAKLVGPRYYLSQIEITTDSALEVYAPTLKPLGQKISSLLNGYGIQVPRYEVTAIHLNFDQLGKIPPQPGIFFIDRRLNIPYSENVWFAQAPLKTADHIALLETLER